MPASSDAPVRPIRVAPSATLELMWVMHFAEADHEHGGAFASLEVVRRSLGRELTSLRQDGMRQYSGEMLILAHRSGTLLDLDLDRFFDRLEAAMVDPAPIPILHTESPDEVRVATDRLASLRSDPARRKRYAEVLRELWAAVEPEWRQEGKAAVIAEAARWTRALAQGLPYRQLLEAVHLWATRPDIDALADRAAEVGDLVLTPCWFGGKIHIIDFDGVFYVGRGMRHRDRSYRHLAAEVSGRIKALADPTRLAILLSLAREPASVTDIAREFQLSQPTVSGHVQVLREAGLLEEKTVGRRAMLSASEDGLRRLFNVAEESLIQAFRS